jgi:hypothetical protein
MTRDRTIVGMPFSTCRCLLLLDSGCCTGLAGHELRASIVESFAKVANSYCQYAVTCCFLFSSRPKRASLTWLILVISGGAELCNGKEDPSQQGGNTGTAELKSCRILPGRRQFTPGTIGYKLSSTYILHCSSEIVTRTDWKPFLTIAARTSPEVVAKLNGLGVVSGWARAQRPRACASKRP